VGEVGEVGEGGIGSGMWDVGCLDEGDGEVAG
jgi:hypothetical protein